MKIIRVNKFFNRRLPVKADDWLSELCRLYLLAQETKSSIDIEKAKKHIRKALADAPGYEGFNRLDRKTVKLIRRRPPRS